MPLDRVLISHLDDMDGIEDSINDEIDRILSAIDIEELINDPEGYMLDIIDVLQDRLEENYFDKAAENGIMLAKKIREDGEIEIQDSNNPELNA